MESFELKTDENKLESIMNRSGFLLDGCEEKVTSKSRLNLEEDYDVLNFRVDLLCSEEINSTENEILTVEIDSSNSPNNSSPGFNFKQAIENQKKEKEKTKMFDTINIVDKIEPKEHVKEDSKVDFLLESIQNNIKTNENLASILSKSLETIVNLEKERQEKEKERKEELKNNKNMFNLDIDPITRCIICSLIVIGSSFMLFKYKKRNT